MDRYFNTFEAQTPDFVARIWLGETYAGEHTYEGRTTERHETKIPMSYLVENAATQDLILSKVKDTPCRKFDWRLEECNRSNALVVRLV